MTRALLATAHQRGLDLSAGGTFARALAAYYFTQAPTDGSSAFLASAGSGVRRVENRGDGLGRCLLMEKAATNILHQSRDMNASGWSGLGATSNDEEGPDGVVTATRVVCASGAVGSYRAPIATNASGRYVGSIWVKRKRGLGSGTIQGEIPTWTSVGAGAIVSGAITETYQRLDGSADSVSTSPNYLPCEGRAGGAFSAMAIDAEYDLHQVEEGWYPTSPIVTTSADVTRPADSLYYASGAYPASFLSMGLVIEFAPDASSAEIDSASELWHLVGIENTTVGAESDYGVSFHAAGSGAVMVRLEGALAPIADTTITFSRGQHLAIKAEPLAGKLTVSGATTGNGTFTGTGTAWPGGLSLYIGNDSTTAHPATGRFVGARLVGA